MAEAPTEGADTHQWGNVVLGGKDAHRDEMIGALRMHAQGFGWKSRKSGKVVAVSKSDLRAIEWVKVPHAYMLRLRARGALTYKFSGLNSKDKALIKTYCSDNFGIAPVDVNLSFKGWNWGEASVEGVHLMFSVNDDEDFDVPINDVTQARTEKEMAIVEMADDDTALPEDEMVAEIRFHVPTTGEDDEGGELHSAEALVLAIQDSGGMGGVEADNAIAAFDDVPVQVPRGRYDIELFDKYIKLHGKTYDYKVLYTNIGGIYVLPKADNYHMAIVLTLEHPLRQGATMYPHVVMQLPRDEQRELTLSLSEAEVAKRFNGKLEQEEQGSTTDVMAKTFSAFTKKKVQGPKADGFNASKDDKHKSIRCSMKAVDGQLYPLDKCFFFLSTKPLLLEFDHVGTIEFNRVDQNSSASAARTFDISLYMKDNTKHQFVNLPRGDYNELFRFLTSKRIRIKNITAASKAQMDEDDDDDDDTYRGKRSRQSAPPEDMDDDDEDEGEDEDFAPGEDSDVDEEYDEGPVRADEGAGSSKHKAAQSESDDDADSDEDEPPPPRKQTKQPAQKPSKSSASTAKVAAPKGAKDGGKKKRAKKDKNEPKRGQSAYFLWLNANRQAIKAEHPEAKVTEIAKLGGARWKEMNAAARAPWEEKAKADKARYEREMAAYKAQAKAQAANDDDDDSDDADADDADDD